MSEINPSNIIHHFSKMKDPRLERNKLHLLIDIIVITICAVICHCETWDEIALYGKYKIKWLKKFLSLPNGIPSHDTFRRVFLLLDPKQLQECFASWVKSMQTDEEGEIISIDGKTIRRSFDKKDGKHAIHMVNAWANKNRLVLGQIKTDDKSNEITAIPELLKLLDIKGCLVTLDAMGCQKKIAKKIIEAKANYLFSLKGNHEIIHDNVKEFFEDAIEREFKDVTHDYHKTVDKGHGRIEIRECFTVSDIDWLEEKKDWLGLQTIGVIRATREIGDKKTTELRYFISSLPNNAKLFAEAVRAHWGVENSLHWVLDIVFNEDDSRIRKDNSPENFAIIRRIAMNLMKKDTKSKHSLKARRKRAGWDDEYLEYLLFQAD